MDFTSNMLVKRLRAVLGRPEESLIVTMAGERRGLRVPDLDKVIKALGVPEDFLEQRLRVLELTLWDLVIMYVLGENQPFDAFLCPYPVSDSRHEDPDIAD